MLGLTLAHNFKETPPVAQLCMSAEKNGLWYSLKSNRQMMEVEVGIGLWLSIAIVLGLAVGLGLGLALVIAKLISYV